MAIESFGMTQKKWEAKSVQPPENGEILYMKTEPHDYSSGPKHYQINILTLPQQARRFS